MPQRARNRYLHSLRLLSGRDLRVRYATSWLGYLWSVLDPLVMGMIYLFIFTYFLKRDVGEQPYVVFLLTALFPWVWFSASLSDFTRAFRKDARLVRSTAIPRSVWVNRIVVSKGMEFLFAIPVVAFFAIVFGAQLHIGVLWVPVAVLLQALLLVGLGLLIAPLCVLFTDLERTTSLLLRALFYGSPIIYGIGDLPDNLSRVAAWNPLAGIFSLYRMAFFPGQANLYATLVSVGMIVVIFGLGLTVFRRLEATVLKEL
ncbi:ABC transporter permease [Microbacterium sp. YY-01]|uniref:ABC transporter permease n=1 Tax=Microbacterium sp. YY-01 TaxID=3421634 RepID=UPI003D173D60